MGTPFGRYILEERIGQGGMAEVFRARLVQDGFEKVVCIKRILSEHQNAPGFSDMLRDEASLAARLAHSNIVQTFDFGEVDGTLFIAMELVDGVSLSKVLRALNARRARLRVGHALEIGVALSRALHHAHTAMADGKPLGMVHRDVSPQNVLIGADGAVKLSDFGIARAEERRAVTMAGVMKGKSRYMAPEQIEGGRGDHRIDQFAMGTVLWECLVGKRLFDGKTHGEILDAVVRCQVDAPSTLRSDVPPGLDQVVLRMLAKDPAQRFPDMAAVDAALAPLRLDAQRTPEDSDLRPLVAEARRADIVRAAPAPITGLRTDEGPAHDTEVDGAPPGAAARDIVPPDDVPPDDVPLAPAAPARAVPAPMDAKWGDLGTDADAPTRVRDLRPPPKLALPFGGVAAGDDAPALGSAVRWVLAVFGTLALFGGGVAAAVFASQPDDPPDDAPVAPPIAALVDAGSHGVVHRGLDGGALVLVPRAADGGVRAALPPIHDAGVRVVGPPPVIDAGVKAPVRVVDNSPKARARGLAEDARHAYEAGDLDAALRLAQQAVTTAPDEPSGWSQLARVRRKRGEHAEAKAALTRFLEIMPVGREADRARLMLQSYDERSR